MFAYNPTVQDRSGEIIASAANNASEIYAQGMQNFGQSIGQGLAGLGGSIGKRLEQKQEDAAKAASIGEALNTMQAILPTYGSEGVALQEIITNRVSEAGNNLDKMSGILMAFQPAVQNLQSRVNQAASIEGYKDLADYKAALGGSDSTPTAPRMNAENIRSMVAEAKAEGFSDDAIKSKLQSQYGDWAVRSVYPPQNQGIWMGQ